MFWKRDLKKQTLEQIRSQLGMHKLIKGINLGKHLETVKEKEGEGGGIYFIRSHFMTCVSVK